MFSVHVSPQVKKKQLFWFKFMFAGQEINQKNTDVKEMQQ